MLVDDCGGIFEELPVEEVQLHGVLFFAGQRMFSIEFSHPAAGFEQTAHAGGDHFHIKWFGYVHIRAGGVAFDLVGVGLPCGEEDHGDMACTPIGFYGAAEFETAEVGHHDVADDEVGDELQCFFETGGAVAGYGGAVDGRELAADVVAEVGVVFDEKD